jgi:NCAIR mutase (PurE)-related protein
MKDFILDYERPARIGLGEAIFCAGKTPAQIDAIIADAERRSSLLLTRLAPEVFATLETSHLLDYDPLSRTAFLGPVGAPDQASLEIGIVTAGTSDLFVAREAARTLQFNRSPFTLIADVGVAGLWRLLSRVEDLKRMKVIIAVAGMDAALPTVLGGLVPGCIIAVPTSVGYGVAEGGHAALNAILSSCSPGILTVNIDNGYGAACAALRISRIAT